MKQFFKDLGEFVLKTIWHSDYLELDLWLLWQRLLIVLNICSLLFRRKENT